MFGCYRKGDANDPDTYVAAVAAVLAGYDLEVIRKVTDPRFGLPRRLSWMPTVKEVADACDDEHASATTIARYAAMPKHSPRHIAPPSKAQGSRANVFVPADAPQYGAMLERSRDADPADWRYDEKRPGIWVTLPWLDEADTRNTKSPRRFTTEDLQRIYAKSDAAEAAE